MATFFDVQHVIDELFIISVTPGEVNIVGVNDQKRRRIVVEKELAVHLIKLLKVGSVDQPLGINSAFLDSFQQPIRVGLQIDHKIRHRRVHPHFFKDFLIQRVLVGIEIDSRE